MKPVSAPLTAFTPPVMPAAITGTVKAMPTASTMEATVVRPQVMPMFPMPG